jgi:hypothetical protein
MTNKPYADDPAYLMSLVTKDPDGCWTYNGRHRDQPSPGIKYHGVQTPAKRVIYAVLMGGIAPQMQLYPSCHHQGCVNPNHMLYLTRAEMTALIASTTIKKEAQQESKSIQIVLDPEAELYPYFLSEFWKLVAKEQTGCWSYNGRSIDAPMTRIPFISSHGVRDGQYTPIDEIVYFYKMNGVDPGHKLYHECLHKGCVNPNHMLHLTPQEFMEQRTKDHDSQFNQPQGLVLRPVRRRHDGSIIIPDGFL